MTNRDINWNRYHELLEIQSQRKFTTAERKEYQTYIPLVQKLDKNELEICKPDLRGLAKKIK